MNLNRNQSFSCLVFFLILLIYSMDAQSLGPPTANLSTTWINKPSPSIHSATQVSTILSAESNGMAFVFGFYCNFDSSACLLSVLILPNTTPNVSGPSVEFAKPVWSANRDYPVKVSATLELTKDGDLILADADDTPVWSTNTTSKSVSGLTLAESGELVLFDDNNEAVWSSFDHPTDSLVDGQILFSGMELTASTSPSPSNSTKGLFSLAINGSQLIGYVDANPPQFYFFTDQLIHAPLFVFSQFKKLEPNGSLENGFLLFFMPGYAARFMKLEPNGHLVVYEWVSSQWDVVWDILTAYTGECGYPMVCGRYGVCTNGICSCPEAASNGTIHFKQLNNWQPNPGCEPVTPISCEHFKDHTLLELQNTDYFFFQSDMENVDIENCKLACLRNCSCKAAIFRYGSVDTPRGGCFLPSEIFSLRNTTGNNYNVTMSSNGTLYASSNEKNATTITFVKVQNIPASANAPKSTKDKNIALPIGATLGGFFCIVLVIGAAIFYLQKKGDLEEDDEDNLDELPGLSTRFSYEDLKDATENFSRKLGDGGFGSVFEGIMRNGTKIAVKRLNGIGQVKKSFLAEVQTIGNIHHVNLVRLIGFCAEKSQRLLVYEYMCNGSLDKWIFHGNQALLSLEWQLRRKIISGIAKGLAYLHEECRQKILHLDIKPQNILLDENFDAKVADFGLSKLMSKEQSRLVATMRGTPGYMAPEWMSSVITDKVDVYSFGVVVLEIVCGRKNLDRYQPEEDMHLLTLFKRKAEEDQLFDLVDKSSEDMQSHGAEVMEMLRIAAWCLQSEFTKRPSMSVVVKVLEGLMEVESNLVFCFTNPPAPRTDPIVDNNGDANNAPSVLLPLVLSGPR